MWCRIQQKRSFRSRHRHSSLSAHPPPCAQAHKKENAPKASAPSMSPSFLIAVFFVVVFRRHGRSRCTIPAMSRSKLVTSLRGSSRGREKALDKALGKRQWFQDTCHGSCHHILRSGLFTSTQMLSFMVQMWTLGSTPNSRASQKREEGNRWNTLLTANSFP